MILFALGTLLGGTIGIFIMSLMVVAKKSDQFSERQKTI